MEHPLGFLLAWVTTLSQGRCSASYGYCSNSHGHYAWDELFPGALRPKRHVVATIDGLMLSIQSKHPPLSA